MLSDNISDGVRTVFSTAGKIMGGALRGAILFGLIGLAAGTLVAAGPALWAAFSAASIAGWGVASAHALYAGALAMGSSCAAIGAIGGAAVMGVANVIPGSKELFPWVKKLFHRHHSAPAQQPVQTFQPQPAMDNPYYKPGLGASLAERAQAQGAAVSRS